MKTHANFVGWDFMSIWAIDETVSYPYFGMTIWVWDAGGDGVSWTDPLNWNKDLGFPNHFNDKVWINLGGATILTPASLPITVGEISTGMDFSGTLQLSDAFRIDSAGV